MSCPAWAGDWAQFRGPAAAGVSTDADVPLEWSDHQNIRWTAELPGPGSSSPIVWGDRAFVTCYSGYGEGEGGNVADLKRHLVCVDLATGNILWDKSVGLIASDDPYRGFISEHGYASNTPVTDGERIYCFFGKSGVVAFDMQGNQVWQTDVGQESSRMRWGSAASPILYKDMVIVNASEESHSIRALDKASGSERWKAEADLLDMIYSTPSLVTAQDGRQDLVTAVAGEVWGLNPDNGKLRWYCSSPAQSTVCPAVVSDGEIAYVFGGNRGAGSVAVRVGGKDDVTESHVVWEGRASSYITTPVLYEGKFYWADDRGAAHVVAADSGEELKTMRLPVEGRGFYASPIVADGRIYAVSRREGTFVFEPGEELKQLALNVIASDDSQFNATPAVVNSELLLRSDKALYCVSTK
jgi:outer membrane protein assembly factor BamB